MVVFDQFLRGKNACEATDHFRVKHNIEIALKTITNIYFRVRQAVADTVYYN
jgi:hypothetical protein